MPRCSATSEIQPLSSTLGRSGNTADNAPTGVPNRCSCPGAANAATAGESMPPESDTPSFPVRQRPTAWSNSSVKRCSASAGVKRPVSTSCSGSQ